jgi:multicomponent Na+:H+ antiporter subunit F
VDLDPGGDIVTVAIALAMLFVTSALAIARLLMGPTLADRVIALDVLLVSLMGAVAIDAAADGSSLPLGILASVAIVAFTATVALTRFIERTRQP